MGDGAEPPPQAGVLYLAIGEDYVDLTAQSIAFLRRHGYDGPVRVVTDQEPWPDASDIEFVRVPAVAGEWGSRYYKTQLDQFGFSTTLFLDSDTLPIGSIEPLWDELRWGDICLAHDIQATAGQFVQANWAKPHLDSGELRLMREPGFSELGYYNSGVILWRRTEATRRLFDSWRREWLRFRNLDQMALARALKAEPVAVHTLSPVWNCPPGRFGSVAAARRAGVRVLHFLSQQRSLLTRFVDLEDDGDAADANPGSTPTPWLAAASRRIRVLWITGTLFPRLGGIETYVEKTIAHLADHCEVGLVTRNGQWPRNGPPIAHFSLSTPGAQNQTEAWRLMAGWLRGVVDRFEPDVVHFASARCASCRSILPASVATVATVHGNDLTNLRPAELEEDPTAYVVESLNQCDRILTCSEYTSALVREWGVSPPLDTLTPGCDLDFYRPYPELGAAARRALRIPPMAPVVLTVSRLVPRKGHLAVLDAIASLPFQAFWVVAGSGPCAQEIVDAAVERGVADRLLMRGAVHDDELLALYNACDLFVLTPQSRRLGPWLDSEGFGLVLQEAGACGKPVIAAASGGCQEAVIDGGTGLLVPAGDPARLAEAMAAILTDPQRARALGEGGLSLVRMSGGWERQARQVLEVYEDLLTAARIDLPLTGLGQTPGIAL
jgi:glycosyltransferase involved in cell wall biosynthesis